MMLFLVSLAVKGTVVLALGASAAALLRGSSASLHHGVWVATFAALLAVPLLDALGPSWHAEILPRAGAEVSAFSTAALEEEATGPSESTIPSETTVVAMVAPSPASFTDWLAGLWALGVIAVSLLWVRGFIAGRRLVRASQVLTDPVWSARLRATARESGLTKPVCLRRSEVLRVPVAWRWVGYTVVLPVQSDGWDAERARAVLLHEMAHLRRRDAWTQVIAQAALAFHWLNPLAWAAYCRFLITREQACDDAVLEVGSSPSTYASHLVAIARDLRSAPRALATAMPMVGPDELETRVRALLDGRRRRGPAGRRALSATLALAVVVGVPLAAFQPTAPEAHPVPAVIEPEPAPAPSGNGPEADEVARLGGAGAEMGAPAVERRAAESEMDRGNGLSTSRDTVDVRQLEREAAAARRQADEVRQEAARARSGTAAVERAAAAVRRQASDEQRTASEVERQAAEVERVAADVEREAADVRRRASEVSREAARVRRQAADVAREAAQVWRDALPLRDSTRVDTE